MKKEWLNLVLLLTNRIYNKKQQVLKQTGRGTLYNVFALIILEIVLGIISLPLYFGLKSEDVVAFISEKGTYVKVSFDYNLRRVITLTGVGIFALIWAIKLILIIALPSAYGPLPLYSVSNLSQTNILTKDLVANEVGIQTARVIDTMPKPELTAVNKLSGGDYDFVGKGRPGITVVLLLSDQQTAVYSADVDNSGNWKINHSLASFRLNEGNHSVVIFSYDKKLGVKSETAPEQFFKVSSTWQDSLIKNIDTLANWSVTIILLLGVLLTSLTI